MGLFPILLFLTCVTVVSAGDDASLYSIPIEDREDSMYLINLQMGTPKQNFTVQLDTASADFWLIDSSCDTTQCKGRTRKKNRFNSSASSTYMEDGHEFVIEYNVHQGVEGKVGQDTMNVGTITVDRQSFGLATLLDQKFGSMPIDGIVGFGLESLSQTKIKSPLQNILEDLADSSFTIWLGSHALGKRPGGLLTFGGIDNTNCECAWTYLDVTRSGYWDFKASGFEIGNYYVKKEIDAVLNSRENFIAAPTKIFESIIALLNATIIDPYDLYGIPCDQVSSAPDLVFKIKGQEFRVGSQEYIRKLNIIKDKCVVFVADSAFKEGFNDKWVLGDPFMRTVCTNYNTKQLQVGLAAAKQQQN